MSEREARLARIRAGRARVQAEGGRVGGQAPYGWHAKRGVITPDPREQAVIRIILAMRVGHLSYERIAAELNAAGIPTQRAGARWSLERVRQVTLRASGRWAPVPLDHVPGQQAIGEVTAAGSG
jgi:DNA invertase Pin-like site-specific DNA recombinase